MIPFIDIKRINDVYAQATTEAVNQVIASGRYLHGSQTSAFEHELAVSCGARQAVGVSNGLDAIRLIFRGYVEMGRLKPGDKVVVPANTYIASILPITELGLTPVLVEPDNSTLNLDWKAALESVKKHDAKALMTVHLYGAPCWDNTIARWLKEHGILIVEDNAQAIGASIMQDGRRIFTGHLGDAAAFSFYPTKNIGALGDAGAVTTDDENLINIVRALANYGSDRRYHNIYRGWNCRMDETQAAALRIRLADIDNITFQRRQRAAAYNALLKNGNILLPLWQPGSVWHQYVVRVKNNLRDAFREYMKANGVATDIHYATPPHCQPCYENLLPASMPITESLAAEYVSLPIASLSLSEVAKVANIANEFAR